MLGLVAASVVLAIRLFSVQILYGVTDGINGHIFTTEYLDSITQSWVQHSYSIPILGWLLILQVIWFAAKIFKKEQTENDKFLLVLSFTYISFFIFLSVILPMKGFPARNRYGVLLEIISIPILALGIAWIVSWFYKYVGTEWYKKTLLLIFLLGKFVNISSLKSIYDFQGGPVFAVTGNNYFRSKEEIRSCC